MRAAAAIAVRAAALSASAPTVSTCTLCAPAAIAGDGLAVGLGHRGVPVRRRGVHPGPGHPARAVEVLHLSPQHRQIHTETGCGGARFGERPGGAGFGAPKLVVQFTSFDAGGVEFDGIGLQRFQAPGVHLVFGDNAVGAAGDGDEGGVSMIAGLHRLGEHPVHRRGGHREVVVPLSVGVGERGVTGRGGGLGEGAQVGEAVAVGFGDGVGVHPVGVGVCHLGQVGALEVMVGVQGGQHGGGGLFGGSAGAADDGGLQGMCPGPGFGPADAEGVDGHPVGGRGGAFGEKRCEVEAEVFLGVSVAVLPRVGWEVAVERFGRVHRRLVECVAEVLSGVGDVEVHP